MPVTSTYISLDIQESVETITVYTSTTGIMKSIFQVDNKYISKFDTLYNFRQYEKIIDQTNISEHKKINIKNDENKVQTIDVINKISGSFQWKKPIYDIISLIFKLRDINKDKQELFCTANYDLWKVKVKYLKNKVQKVGEASIDCRKYQAEFERVYDNPIESPTDIFTNNLLSEKTILVIWISDDKRKLPVKLQFKRFPFGVIFQLTDFWQKH